ncbi:DNA fragmentation factor subunit beta isoform X1 [Atheta coriaria]|uniref:DNA fragmentation factor subunit beta isoform X1 n=2 Tax=Dalotia coriaria TaxID=877792 RepID=UPI0031F3E0BE
MFHILAVCSQMGGGMGQRKGFKVTDAERKVRVGIAVEHLADLKKKTIIKFKLPEGEDIFFQTRDGIPIRAEDEFLGLPAQTLLIWVRKGERAETDAEILYRTIREVNFDFLTTGEKVAEFFTEQMKSNVYSLAKVLKEMDDDKAKASTKEGDPDWFQGVESRAKTKEEYMFRRSQDRIKKYFYATKDDLLKNRDLPAERVHELCATLSAALKDARYFGAYFDRRDAAAMCTPHGDFQCQGRWDAPACRYRLAHVINPYRSYEERIVFQTWNLDHRIERSRCIIPAIAHALDADARLDCERIFEDLFTDHNLKLVHIVCHDKTAHTPPDFNRYIKLKS